MVSTLIKIALRRCKWYVMSMMYDCKSLSNYHFQNLTEGPMDDKDCFCGGLVKFAEMLTSVEALLCGGEDEGEGRTGKVAAGGKN